MTEHELMNKIRIRLSQEGFRTFRANVGKFQMIDLRWFDTGLPKGFSDIFAVKDGKVYFIEVKVKPNKASKEQLNFLDVMINTYGAKGGVAYSVDEALEIVKDG